MFFILSKILFILLVPFWWIIILLLWRRLSGSAVIKKRLGIIIILLLIVFTNPFIYRSAVTGWQASPTAIPANRVFEAGIVLGGMAGYDKYDHGYFGGNADRFIQVANLYHRGIIKKVMVTGGTGKLQQDEPAEAFFLREQLVYNGIPANDIILETRSRNTYENAVFTKKVLDSMQLKPPYILVTSALHMTRSKQIFVKAGYDFVAYPCDYKVVAADFSVEGYLMPNISLLNEWANLIKEVVGLVVYKITGKA